MLLSLFLCLSCAVTLLVVGLCTVDLTLTFALPPLPPALFLAPPKEDNAGGDDARGGKGAWVVGGPLKSGTGVDALGKMQQALGNHHHHQLQETNKY